MSFEKRFAVNIYKRCRYCWGQVINNAVNAAATKGTMKITYIASVVNMKLRVHTVMASVF